MSASKKYSFDRYGGQCFKLKDYNNKEPIQIYKGKSPKKVVPDNINYLDHNIFNLPYRSLSCPIKNELMFSFNNPKSKPIRNVSLYFIYRNHNHFSENVMNIKKNHSILLNTIQIYPILILNLHLIVYILFKRLHFHLNILNQVK